MAKEDLDRLLAQGARLPLRALAFTALKSDVAVGYVLHSGTHLVLLGATNHVE